MEKEIVLPPYTPVQLHHEYCYDLDNNLALIIHPALFKIKKDTKSFVLIWVKRKDLPKKFKNDFEKDVFELYVLNTGKQEDKVYSKAIEYSQWCLDKMIKAFDLIINVKHPTDKQRKQIKKGLKLFTKYYRSLGY